MAPSTLSTSSIGTSRKQQQQQQTSLEIHLERANKIFYPGETVRGTAILRVPVTLSGTGSVYLDFQAKACTEWVTGGETSVVDGVKQETPRLVHSGETVFQHQVKTLLGCSYQTGALRMKRGKSPTEDSTVDFDKVPGTGDIYIPCADAATQKMKLRVEALGSAMTLDVSKLVAQKTQQIFYMTTIVGNMQKGAIHLSAEVMEYRDFFPDGGKGVKSNYEKCLIVRVHKLRGKQKKGSTDISVSVRVHDITSGLESRSNSGKRIVLEAGDHAFPFRLALRDDAPGSAQWNIGADSASISYSLRAFADLHTTGGTVATHDAAVTVVSTMFSVIANRPLPRPALMSPYRMETGDQPLHSFGWCCRPRSARKFTVSIKMLLGRLAYAPGEVIDLTGSTVINNSATAQRAQIVLCTYLQLTGSDATEKHSLNHHDVVYETKIPPHKTVILTNMHEYSALRVPAIVPSYSGVYLDSDDQTSRLNACVKWAYTLEIRLPDWGSGFYCRTPILIAAAPPYVSQLQEYRKVEANPLLTGQYSIFEHAVSGSFVKCVTAPTLTSLFGDKGRKVLVEQTPASQPVWMGSRADHLTWLKDESNRQRLKDWTSSQQQGGASALIAKDSNEDDFADLAQLFYRNVVNVYAGPSGTFDESLD